MLGPSDDGVRLAKWNPNSDSLTLLLNCAQRFPV